MAIASHLCLGCSHLFERRDGFFRVELLVETDDGIQNNNGDDGGGIYQIAQQGGECTGSDQNPDNEALELAEKDTQRTDALALFELVRPVNTEALCGIVCRQSGGGGTKLCQYFIG